ncbi:MAG: hypothetical protein AAF358_10065 [Pseudomonadota bacterium]
MLAAGSFLLLNVTAGPVRWILSQAGLSPLIYAPNLLMLACVAWHTAAEPHTRGFSALTLIAWLAPVHAMVIGLLFLSPVQLAMGVYVLLPFWFGLSCGPVLLRRWRNISPFIGWFWLIAAGGVLANVVVTFPWEGFGYSVGNLEVDGSRQWYAGGGNKRLAGFSRASFDAAVQIQLLALLMVLACRSFTLRVLIWGLSLAAIYPTNSKGIMLVALIMTPIVLLQHRLPQSPLRVLPALFGVLALALPLSTLLFTFDSQFNDPKLASATFSFFDRLNRMWPEAWELLHGDGNLLLGRGIGGIGTGQTYFESSRFNAGDNLFMYWMVVYGLSAIPGFALILARTLRLRPLESPEQFRVYALVMATLIYGSMTNIVENAVFALVCGMVVRYLCSRPPRRPRMEPAHVC